VGKIIDEIYSILRLVRLRTTSINADVLVNLVDTWVNFFRDRTVTAAGHYYCVQTEANFTVMRCMHFKKHVTVSHSSQELALRQRLSMKCTGHSSLLVSQAPTVDKTAHELTSLQECLHMLVNINNTYHVTEMQTVDENALSGSDDSQSFQGYDKAFRE
jgi:hypothetical protein